MGLHDDVARLRDILGHPELPPGVATDVLPEFSDEVRDALVGQVAREFEPPPPGQLLARLVFVVTDENRDAIVGTYLANLRSPLADGRRASLLGLAHLGYRQITDLAMVSLRDDADPVVAAAVDLLLPLAADDDRVRAVLGQILAAHADDAEFHMTAALLRAAGIGG
jgi:hypothetical protein